MCKGTKIVLSIKMVTKIEENDCKNIVNDKKTVTYHVDIKSFNV